MDQPQPNHVLNEQLEKLQRSNRRLRLANLVLVTVISCVTLICALMVNAERANRAAFLKMAEAWREAEEAVKERNKIPPRLRESLPKENEPARKTIPP